MIESDPAALDRVAALSSLLDAVADQPEEALRRLVELASRLDLERGDAREVALLNIEFRRGSLDSEDLPTRLADLIRHLKLRVAADREQLALDQARSARITALSLERAPKNTVVFECRKVRKSYPGSDFSLGELDLTLRAGEITGVVGQNAHGKTTLLRIVAGETSATSGAIAYPMLDVPKGGPDWGRIKSGIAFVPQELPPWRGDLTDTLLFEAATHGVPPARNERDVAYIMARLGLDEHREKSWKELSGGFKLRVALARALVWTPKLLVLDEPLANLDVLAKSALLEDIRDLAQSARDPIAILMSSHDLFDLEQVCQQMVFLQRGEVQYSGPARGEALSADGPLFMLTTTTPAPRLREVLAALGLHRLREEGLHYLIPAPVDFSAGQLLRALLDADVPVDSFRDISRSIRRLFYKDVAA